MIARFPGRLLTAVALLFLSVGPAHAVPSGPGLFRAYLSISGNDANPCTLPLPCRLLPAALAATANGGEVWLLDSANYNTSGVSVTKSVTILAVPGVIGSIVGTGGSNAIEVSTPGVSLALRNVIVLNFDTGVNGIYFAGAKLSLHGCLIMGFTNGSGVYVDSAAKVDIVETTVRDGADGIRFSGGASGTISRSHLLGNSSTGFWAFPTNSATVTANISDSVMNNNAYGVVASGFGGPSRVYVTRTMASGNSLDGFETSTNGGGTDALLVVSHSIATANGRWGFANFTGTFKSAGNNTVTGNVGDTTGTITAVPPI